MSTAAISYGSLKDAKSEAKDVAKKFDKYADALYKNVYKKLDKYGGGWSDNLSSASSYIDKKIENLRSAQEDYEDYAQKLDDLREECKDVDKTVKSDVSSLTTSFKDRNGIKIGVLEKHGSYLLTAISNGTSAGRWVGKQVNKGKASATYLKDSIKEWYNFEGGKQWLKGVLVATLEIAIGVLSIVGAIVTGGALIVVIAGVIGGVLMAANGIMNMCNEYAALDATMNGEPAIGRRRSEINTIQDYCRSSFLFGEDGETYSYSKFWNGFATGLDVTSFACTVVTLVSSLGKLAKNGYKWATGSKDAVKKINLKTVFSKDTKLAFSQKFTDLKASFKMRGWKAAADLGKNMFKDFAYNLRKAYFNFSDTKSGISSVKSLLGVTKDLISGEFSKGKRFKFLMEKVGLIGMTAFSVNSEKARFTDSTNFTDTVAMNDFYKIGKDFKSKLVGSDLFSQGEPISNNLLKKLSGLSELNISVSSIKMPEITMPVLRVA